MDGQPSKPWTILSLLQWAAEYLRARGFEDARLNAELLLSHVLGLSRIELYTKFDRPLDTEELARFKDLFKRRLQHEPVQYILGETEFMGLKFFVDRSVLIPRPETEVLVEAAVQWARGRLGTTMRVLDIGTGCGNIAVALARFVPGLEITALDISPLALKVAGRNLERHGVTSVRLLEADVFSDVLRGEVFTMIVSNPPYVAEKEFSSLSPEIRDHEPRIATCDESDGLRYIRRVCGFARERLHAGGCLVMEIGYDQADRVRGIAEGAGFLRTDCIRDYSGVDRVLRAFAP